MCIRDRGSYSGSLSAPVATRQFVLAAHYDVSITSKVANNIKQQSYFVERVPFYETPCISTRRCLSFVSSLLSQTSAPSESSLLAMDRTCWRNSVQVMPHVRAASEV